MNRLVRLCLLTGLAIAPACQSSRWIETSSTIDTVVLAVQIEKRMVDGEASEGLFAHPARVEPAALEARLQELRFRRSRLLHEDRTGPVIPPEQLPSLARALAESLARADSSERVRFSVGTQAQSLFEGRRYARGVAFVQPEGVLNVAFDWVDELSERDILDERWEDPTRRRISSVELDSGSAWSAPTEAREDDLLWLRTDLLEPLAPRPRAEEAAPPEATAEPEPQTETPARAEAKPPLTDAERIAQLQLLEKLHRDGVLDDAEFERRRREILDVDH